ncbi:MAG: TetR/AcrR family transcriptional regulator [Chitinophagales bacterium]
MPRASRSPEQIQKVKDRIFEAALQYMTEEGYGNLSMRKLAQKAGMTAANIYNYYTNKDEIYLALQTRGFNLLYRQFRSGYESSNDPVEKLEAMIRAYVDFGVNNSAYYNIMFSWDVPKYIDYVGTELEPIAYLEKEAGLNNIEITAEVINEIRQTRGLTKTENSWHLGIQLWITLNGLVSLINSRVLPEVDQNLDLIKEQTIKRLMEMFA